MTKKITIKTNKDIESFLKECGFDYSNGKEHFMGNGCCEFWRPIEGSDILCCQINGDELSELESPDDVTMVFVYNKNYVDQPSVYEKEWPSFKEMVANEKSVDFSKGLLKYTF